MGDLQKGVEFTGHTSWVSAIVTIPPTEKKQTIWQRFYNFALKCQSDSRITLETYRFDLRRKYRFISGAADGSLFMWDATSEVANYRRERPRFDPDEIAKSGFNLTMKKREPQRKVKNIRKITHAERAAEKKQRATVLGVGGNDDDVLVEIIKLQVAV